MILKNLFIKPEQCLPRIIRIYLDSEEYTGSYEATLASFGMVPGDMKKAMSIEMSEGGRSARATQSVHHLYTIAKHK